MAPALCLVFGIEAEMDQRIVPFARFHDDIAAASAIAARGAAAGNKLLPPEGNAPVAAIPSLHPNSSLIDKHISSVASISERNPPRLSVPGDLRHNHPGNPRGDRAQHLPGDRAASPPDPRRRSNGGPGSPAAPPHRQSATTGISVTSTTVWSIEIRPAIGALWPADENVSAVGKQPVEPVGITNRQQRKPRLPGRGKRVAIPGRLTRLQGSQRGHLGLPLQHRSKARFAIP